MSSPDDTVKLVKDLDRAAVEAKLAEVRGAARKHNLAELVAALTGIEGLPRAQLEQRVLGAQKLVRGKSEHKLLLAQLELAEINLPNLK
jgi:hypothetical protein